MFRFILPFIFILSGCGAIQKADSVGILDATLRGSEIILDAVQRENKDRVACYVTAGFSTAVKAVRSTIGTSNTVPSIEIDVSPCTSYVNMGPVIGENVKSTARVLAPLVFAGLEALISSFSEGEETCSEESTVKASDVLNYLKLAVDPVISELAEPTGKLIIPEFTLPKCENPQ